MLQQGPEGKHKLNLNFKRLSPRETPGLCIHRKQIMWGYSKQLYTYKLGERPQKRSLGLGWAWRNNDSWVLNHEVWDIMPEKPYPIYMLSVCSWQKGMGPSASSVLYSPTWYSATEGARLKFYFTAAFKFYVLCILSSEPKLQRCEP